MKKETSFSSIVPFIRGIDLSGNDFKMRSFPSSISEMNGLKWLYLNETNLMNIPRELEILNNLEQISLSYNNISKIHGELTQLYNLKSAILKHNQIKSSGIPSEFFDIKELSVVDLSHNLLKEVPVGIEKSKSLFVLNLSFNRIECIPNHIFTNLTDLLYLDLSHNKLETLPPQLRRLTCLQSLILDDNPLLHFQLRQLPSLVSLKCLKMRNTQRNLKNIPDNISLLTNLWEVNFSENNLNKIPNGLLCLHNLKILNISGNNITELPQSINTWTKLEVLNISRNKISSLPLSFCKLSNLRRFYCNENYLNFEGIPSGIGKLCFLEVFMAAHNKLEMVPESLFRCVSLKKLILSNNQLITLPETIYLAELDLLDLSNNPNLIMPQKPEKKSKENDVININNMLFERQITINTKEANEFCNEDNYPKDTLARKIRLRRSKKDQDEVDNDQAKILKGMKDITTEKYNDCLNQSNSDILRPKRWDESLEKPKLNYSEFFEEDTGQLPGITIWDIENFLPSQIDENFYGQFYNGDCYIILQTALNDVKNLEWKIYFWIGSKSSIDKKACAAVHSVNLRNYLQCSCRTVRIEEGEEISEFLNLFDNFLIIDGSKTASGFYTFEKPEHPVRLYKVYCHGSQLVMETMMLCKDILDHNFCYLLDTEDVIYIWIGLNSKKTDQSKVRLLAEKINKTEKRSLAEIHVISSENQKVQFLSFFDANIDDHKFFYSACKPILYQVWLGLGYLELTQIDNARKKLVQSFLQTNNTYILDCHNDIFIWIGLKSTKLLRAAVLKLAQKLFYMLERPSFSLIHKIVEGAETISFKSKFIGWDNVIAVDFTRNTGFISQKRADIKEWEHNNQFMTADLTALFMPKQQSMPFEEAMQLSNDWNEDLDVMEAYVLEGKKFIKLPENEFGHFYNEDCYVFLCRYWLQGECSFNEKKDDKSQDTEDFQCIIYFWQGRRASKMGWLTFKFSLCKKFESLFSGKLETIKMMQQQENLKFLSHFHRKFIIYQGKRGKQNNNVEFFHIRTNGNPICTRCIQVKPDASLLNSFFCYILIIHFNSESNLGIKYVWIGEKSSLDESRLAEDIAVELHQDFPVQVLYEGEEPENFFWLGLGGQKNYERNGNFINELRLFRCSNEKGYFAISEKCQDFCQDDLEDEDIMILDNGSSIFLWLGSQCSDTEIKMAYKSVQYIQKNFMIEMHSFNASQQKIAEKLTILNHRGIGMLTRIYNIKKACVDPASKPKFLSDKKLESSLKQINKKFPNIDVKNLQSVADYKADIYKTLSIYYNTFVEILDFKDHVTELLTSIDACLIILDINLNYDLTKHYLDLVIIYVTILLFISKVEDRKIALGLYGASYEMIKNQMEPNYHRMGKMITEYEQPFKKLVEEFGPHSKVLMSALFSLYDVYMNRIIIYDNWRKSSYLSIKDSSQHILAASRNDLFPSIGCEYLSQEILEKWIIFGFLLCPIHLKDSKAVDMWAKVLQNVWVVTLFRDEVIYIHSEIANIFESYKGFAKRSSEMKELYNFAVQNAPHLHREKRKFLRIMLRELTLLVLDQPGLLGPKALLIFTALSTAQYEVLWLLYHSENSQGKNLKVKSSEDLVDRLLPEILFHMEELRALIKKYAPILQRYYVQFLSGQDSVFLNQIIQQINNMPEEDSIILSSVYNIISSLHVKKVEENEILNFQNIRLDWFRLQSYASSSKNYFSLNDKKELAYRMNTIIFHTEMVDNLDDMLFRTADLSIFCFYNKFFETNFRMCLEFPAQNRYIIAFPLICAHFQNCVHELCPEEIQQVKDRSVFIANNFLDELAKEAKNIITAICDEHCLMNDKILAELLNRHKKDKIKKNLDTYKPGIESYRKTREHLTTMDKLHMALTELCFAINYCPTITVWEYIFAPREYLTQYLESRFSKALIGMALYNVETKEIARPSELLMRVKSYMDVLQSIENYVYIDMTRVFNNVLLQQTQSNDSNGEKTISSLYKTWYSETFLRCVNGGSIVFSPNQQVFVSLNNEGSFPFSAEEFTDRNEMHALVQLIGSYGVKFLSETLMWQISSQVEKLRLLVNQNRDHLKIMRTNFEKPIIMKDLAKRLTNVDDLLRRMTIIGVIFKFHQLLQEALTDTLFKHIPFLICSLEDFWIESESNENMLLKELCSSAGFSCKVYPELILALQKNKVVDMTEESYFISCLLLVFVAVSLPRLAKIETSIYYTHLEAHANNIHCLGIAVSQIFTTLFTMHEHDDVVERLKEFLAVQYYIFKTSEFNIQLASSSLLRLGQEPEKDIIKFRESVYLVLHEVSFTYENNTNNCLIDSERITIFINGSFRILFPLCTNSKCIPCCLQT